MIAPTEVTKEPLHVTLVLDPDLTFDQISQEMIGAGWKVADQSAHPLLPGEPEHATFKPRKRRTPGRVQYTFDPACQLRVLDVEDPRSPPLPDLPAADHVTVAIWLQSDDERTLLRGILAARNLREPGLLDRVERHVENPQAVIAAAAQSTAIVLRAIVAARSEAETLLRTADAREESLAAIRQLEEQLKPLLRELGQDPDGSTSAALRPRPEDYGLVFIPTVAEQAREAFEAVWATDPRVERVPSKWVVECHVSPGGMLAWENELTRHFPSGYQAIAHLLDPHRVWIRWRYLRPGGNAGISYDGLVWLDDHWAWFPKPYRVLQHLVEER